MPTSSREDFVNGLIGEPVPLVGGLSGTRAAKDELSNQAFLMVDPGFILDSDIPFLMRRQVGRMGIPRAPIVTTYLVKFDVLSGMERPRNRTESRDPTLAALPMAHA